MYSLSEERLWKKNIYILVSGPHTKSPSQSCQYLLQDCKPELLLIPVLLTACLLNSVWPLKVLSPKLRVSTVLLVRFCCKSRSQLRSSAFTWRSSPGRSTRVQGSKQRQLFQFNLAIPIKMPSAEDDPHVKSTRYGSVMSTPNINRLLPQEHADNRVKFNRSSSVGPGMTASTLNPHQRNRRALYVNLPFFRYVLRI